MSTLRITSGSVSDRFLTNVQRTYRELAKTDESISTGQRVNRPSDDPLATAQAMLRQVDLAAIEQAKRSAAQATSMIGAIETGVSSLNDLLTRARELTVQGATATYNQSQRDGIAAEIDQLIAHARAVVSTRSGDNYVFSGTATDTAPYAAGSDTYLGNTSAVIREIGPAATVEVSARFMAVGTATPVSLNAQSLLGEGQTSGDGRMLATLQAISDHLKTGDLGALGGSDLAALQANQNAFGNARAALGAAQNRVDIGLERMSQLAVTTNAVLADMTGTDLTKAVVDLNSQKTAYTAALQSGATIVQTSLLDFIR